MNVTDSEEEERDQSRMLRRGVSIVVSKNKWRSEQYAVRKPFVNDVIMRLNCGEPAVDAFATVKNKRWPHHWGPGNIQHPNSFDECWHHSVAGLIWANPPFSLLDRVIKKAWDDQAKMILICPDWDDEDFYDDMWKMTRNYYFYFPGTKFFELHGRAVGGVPWGVWAVYIDASIPEEGHLREGAEAWVDSAGTRKTPSSRRRWRRRKQDQQ